MTDKPITSAELLLMRAQAADAENAAITCSRNVDRLTRAYAALEVEVVKLRAELDAAMKEQQP